MFCYMCVSYCIFYLLLEVNQDKQYYTQLPMFNITRVKHLYKHNTRDVQRPTDKVQ